MILSEPCTDSGPSVTSTEVNFSILNVRQKGMLPDSLVPPTWTPSNNIVPSFARNSLNGFTTLLWPSYSNWREDPDSTALQIFFFILSNFAYQDINELLVNNLLQLLLQHLETPISTISAVTIFRKELTETHKTTLSNPDVNKMTSKHQLQSMDPYDFEQLIADLWEAKGYQTSVRTKSRDRGIDVEAEMVGRKEMIQAKCYSSGNKVGSEEVRKYATLYQQVPTANLVVIVTSSSFTREATKLANDLSVDIYDGDDLIQDIRSYNISINSSLNNSSNFSSTNKNLTKTAQELARKARGSVTKERLLRYGSGAQIFENQNTNSQSYADLPAVAYFCEENPEWEISEETRHIPHYILWNKRGFNGWIGARGHRSSLWITDKGIHYFIPVKQGNDLIQKWGLLLKEDISEVEGREGITKDRLLYQTPHGKGDFYVNKKSDDVKKVEEYIRSTY